MISPELCRAISDARAALPSDPEWSMMNSLPPAAAGPIDGPADYVDLLRTSDGPICGDIVVFSASSVGRSQIYADPQEGVPVRLDRDTWFCFGKVNEDPLFLSRADNTVWGFPDRGILWWQSDRFEQYADDLDQFVLDYAFGGGYLSLAEDGQWARLLRHIGRVS